MNKHDKNVFITCDITLNNERVPSEYDNGMEGFELTEDFENFLDFVQNYSIKATEDEKKTAESFADTFPQSLQEIKEWIDHEPSNSGGHGALYEEWIDSVSHEERYQVPMINTLRYFPSFVSFENEDRYKVASNTCLLYDSELDAWAVGMTGGGMDLAPHLLDTFMRLGKGVPLELAESLRKNYNAYIEQGRHAENCESVARALLDYGVRLAYRGVELSDSLASDDTIKRHLKGLQK
jgi:hypothetical protein